MTRSDVYLGAALIVLALVLWLYLVPAWVVMPGNIRNFYMAPDFWIRVISVGMFLIGATLVLRNYRASAPQQAGSQRVLRRIARLCAGLVVFVSYYLLLEPLGIVLTSALAIIATTLLYGERRWRYIVPLAPVLPTILYFFFVKVASVPLPNGILTGIGPF